MKLCNKELMQQHLQFFFFFFFSNWLRFSGNLIVWDFSSNLIR